MSNPTSVRYEDRDDYDSQTDSDQLGSFGDGGMEGEWGRSFFTLLNEYIFCTNHNIGSAQISLFDLLGLCNQRKLKVMSSTCNK